MPTEQELIDERRRKLNLLREKGIEPYPYSYAPTHNTAQVQEKYASLKTEEKTQDTVKVAGRVIGLRRMGKATFLKLLDRRGTIQAYLKQDDLGKDKYKLLKLIDRGDWLGVEGDIFKTKTGELTVYVSEFTLLTKTLRPLPEKYHGLKDTETRYRQRYVDLIVNPQVRKVFEMRTRIVDAVREVLNKHDFLEVETPILQPIYGGAAAKPFKSELNALHMPVYMRISNELYLKRLIVGGFERVYEFSKDFRNESIDRTHNPEFTQVEFYQAYADYEDMMALFEEIYESAAMKVLGTTKVTYQGKTIDFKRPWKRLRMVDAIKEIGGVDVEKLSDKEVFALKDEYKLDVDFELSEGEVMGSMTRGKIIEALFEKLCEDKIIQPTFITHHPFESTPLCKQARDDPSYVERFEPFIATMEMGNAYSELNDPIQQRTLLERQQETLEKGDEEAHPLDEDFIRAIEYGMPPTGGCGLSIDRMTMIFADQPSIRDVLLFPFMKPEHVEGHATGEPEEKKE